jgi:uncharacterized membrane protein YfcA
MFPAGQALGIALPLLIVADVGTLLLLRRSAKWVHILAALPWALAGIGVGSLFARWTVSLPGTEGDALLRRTVACILIFLILFGAVVKMFPAIASRSGSEEARARGEKPRARRWFSALMGVLGGISTMLANNSGPAWVIYLMSFKLSPKEFLGTAAWLFFCQNLAKLPFGISLGFVTAETAMLVLFLLPPVVLGLFVGSRVIRRVPEKLFNNLTQLVTLVCALYILIV